MVTCQSSKLMNRKITHLVFEKDTETYALQRDAQVIEACKKAGVEYVVKSGHTLWDVEDVVNANNGHPTMTQSALLKVIPPCCFTNLGCQKALPSSEAASCASKYT
jgi:DNA photolyase